MTPKLDNMSDDFHNPEKPAGSNKRLLTRRGILKGVLLLSAGTMIGYEAKKYLQEPEFEETEIWDPAKKAPESPPPAELEYELMKKWYNRLQNLTSAEKRYRFLTNLPYPFLSYNLTIELSEFNAKHNISLKPMGIKRKNDEYDFVLINTWQNPLDGEKLPLSMELKYTDVSSINFLPLLKQKFQKEKKIFADQHKIWKKGADAINIPKKNQTSFLLAAVPHNHKSDLSGIESDFAQLFNIYTAGFQAGSSEYTLMQRPEVWADEMKKTGYGYKLPYNHEPTPDNINRILLSSLIKAIEQKKKLFIFDYMMHGGNDGTTAAIKPGWRLIRTRKKITDWDSKSIADILAIIINGRPLGEQIDILININSCYSGSQLNRILGTLMGKGTPIKNLYIITSAGSDTAGDAGITPDRASLVSDSMKKDYAEIRNYYFVYYFNELLPFLKKQGTKINPPLGTYGHATVFADRMTQQDSRYSQNMQGWHYSTMHGISRPIF